MPKPCRHIEDHPSCRICELDRTREDYRKLWSAMVVDPVNKMVSVKMCIHLGVSVHPPEAPDNVRAWKRCGNGYGIVCACKGCGPKCPGYEAE